MTVVGARKARPEELTLKEANEFLSSHHRAGATSEAKVISIGLYTLEGDELVAVAQFCTPRTSAMKKLYTTELLRLAFKKGYRVPGGASKLMNYFRKMYSPADIFTYQDTTGEVTAVYEHCGFTLVKHYKKKQYLVAPGKTLATATRKEALGMAYATRYGPDRILGTKFGELHHEDGSRKTNRELFTEELGWHVEETTGDRIYEWVNPDRTFYTYKITATDSDKYYYGVSHVKKGSATFDDCLTDGYFGSGGAHKANKFTNWKRKHKATLTKEIIGTHSRASAAFQEEAKLIGALWSTDPLCLNSTTGGKDAGLGRALAVSSMQECSIHGLTSHIGSTCRKCSMSARTVTKACPIHGVSPHLGDLCYKCANASYTANCELHGAGAFQRGVCRTCVTLLTHKQATCPVHGETTHQGLRCSKCQGEALYRPALCETHGLTLHKGSTCAKCEAIARVTLKHCEVHGECAHFGDTCSRCSASQRMSNKICATHGEVAFNGSTCTHCQNASIVTIKECPVHGASKHQGARCSKCANSALIAVRECPVHGLVKHRKSTCYSCIADKKRQNKLDKIVKLNTTKESK